MFKRLLVANRGESAVRVIRTCRELGVESVVVYSEVDGDTLAVKLADHAVRIGPQDPRDSYLNIPRVLSAAEISSAEAVHPGYGFLAENAEFAEAVESCKLAFVGPTPDTIRRNNDRLGTRVAARELGIPVLPGSDGDVNAPDDARTLADKIGYPVAFKTAVRSRKLWVVRRDKDLENTLRMAQAEAKALFGDVRVYLEKYIEKARHIEIQILRDSAGRVFRFHERECTVQHRQEKILDEAPSPLVTAATRRKLSDWSAKFVDALQYRNAGTVEFIADEAGDFFLMGMNSSLGVAHPVTEVLTGCDLVAEQIRIAAGEPVSNEAASITGELPKHAPHVIQCRIGAEDPEKDFMPTSGVLSTLRFPGGPGVRVDSHCFAGYKGTALYDTLVGKVTAWDMSRDQVIARMERALQETVIEGVQTTREFLQKILRLGTFRKGDVYTSMVEQEILGLHS